MRCFSISLLKVVEADLLQLHARTVCNYRMSVGDVLNVYKLMMMERREINNVTLGIDCIFCDTRMNNHKEVWRGRTQKAENTRAKRRREKDRGIYCYYNL